MIKELIFQKQKWYQGEVPNYIGKMIIQPRHIYNYWQLDNDGNFKKFSSGSTISSDYIPKGKVKGQWVDYSGNIYLINEGASFGMWFKLHDLIEYGGVSSSPLTNLYQGLRHLLDRKVALVND